MEKVFFSGVHRDENIVKQSSSGGAFTAISDMWLKKHGDSAVIYGCVMGSDLKAKHIRSTDATGRDLMRGSKYVSSDMTGIYQQVEEDVQAGRYVLFSGTPCQVAAVKSYLNFKNIMTDGRLFTMDFVCHGVAESEFFYDYVNHLEKKYRSKAVSCSFREKNRQGKLNAMKIVFENKKQFISPSTSVDWFYSAYYRNLVIRPVCFKCKYASVDRVSDISLGDYWNPSCAASWGESLIMCNTEQGVALVNELESMMKIDSINFDVTKQPQLCGATQKPEDYDCFHKIYREKGYLEAQRYIGNNTVKGRAKCFAISVLDRLNLIAFFKKIKGMIL